MNRLLNPATNPAGYALAAAVAYLISQLASGHADLAEPRLYLPVVVAAWAFWTRSKVTPVADPKDGNGNPLKTADAHAADNFRAAVKASAVPVADVQPPSTTTGGTQ